MGLLYEEETYAIRGAIFDVYQEMGCGFVEPVYQESMERELAMRGIPFVAQPEIRLFYKGELLNQTYRPDFICYDRIILELKALEALCPKHRAQVLNYLKATRLKVGLLTNFGAHPEVEIERFVL